MICKRLQDSYSFSSLSFRREECVCVCGGGVSLINCTVTVEKKLKATVNGVFSCPPIPGNQQCDSVISVNTRVVNPPFGDNAPFTRGKLSPPLILFQQNFLGPTLAVLSAQLHPLTFHLRISHTNNPPPAFYSISTTEGSYRLLTDYNSEYS